MAIFRVKAGAFANSSASKCDETIKALNELGVTCADNVPNDFQDNTLINEKLEQSIQNIGNSCQNKKNASCTDKEKLKKYNLEGPEIIKKYLLLMNHHPNYYKKLISATKSWRKSTKEKIKNWENLQSLSMHTLKEESFKCWGKWKLDSCQ